MLQKIDNTNITINHPVSQILCDLSCQFRLQRYLWAAIGICIFLIPLAGCTIQGNTRSVLTEASGSEIGDKVDSAMQQQWMKQTVKQLKRIEPAQCVRHIEPQVIDLEDAFMVSYRLTNQEGCITFPNGDWIYMVAHSSHDDKAIGDLTLAIDNRGRLFSNEGHVCGGIIHFYTDSDEELTGADDFFSRFLSDCDDCRWYQLDRSLQKAEPAGG